MFMMSRNTSMVKRLHMNHAKNLLYLTGYPVHVLALQGSTTADWSLTKGEWTVHSTS